MKLYIKENNKFKEIIHSYEYAKILGITPDYLNVKRMRGKIKIDNFKINGGYYFIIEKNHE